MPTRFDHAVIGVQDLDAALERFQHLGFDAQPGGRHADGGTHNGLIRFGLDYIELLAVYDAEAARASGRNLLTELGGREAVLTGFALATRTIVEDAARFHGTEAELSHPRAMGRKRPDGQALTWRVLTPGETLWGHSWPFLIQWDMPDEERLRVDLPGVHANGAYAWRRVTVVVADETVARDVYLGQLGLKLVEEADSPAYVARRFSFAVGEGIIDVLVPDGDGPAQRVLTEKGAGPYELYIAVKNLVQTRTFLTARGIGFATEPAEADRLLLDLNETLGVCIYLVD